MTRHAPVILVLLAVPAMLGMGKCKKEETTANTAATEAPPPPPPPDDAGAAPAEGEVTSYPGEVPLGGTYVLRRNMQVHAAADAGSKVITGLSAGTWVEGKSTYAGWTKIMWPSGVGQLSPGWIHAHARNNTEVFKEEKDAGLDAGVRDAAVDVAVPDAAAVVDAGGDGGRRPVIRIPPRR